MLQVLDCIYMWTGENNGKVLNHQQTVLNKSCSFAYNLLMKCVSCFYKKLFTPHALTL